MLISSGEMSFGLPSAANSVRITCAPGTDLRIAIKRALIAQGYTIAIEDAANSLIETDPKHAPLPLIFLRARAVLTPTAAILTLAGYSQGDDESVNLPASDPHFLQLLDELRQQGASVHE